MRPDKIQAVIVDDERLSRKRLRRLLSAEPDIEVLAECAGAQQAVEFLSAQEADLLFLDVQMPQMDGFAVLESLPPARIPVVIFVTAYDEYAPARLRGARLRLPAETVRPRPLRHHP
ncbi:MAG TPA: response regulator [Bryobacterales bacterium]|nr:response regulator [Bryobacterales bacterium]